MTCTVPKLLGLQSWFDARFTDLCLEHDRLYSIRSWQVKLYADFSLAMHLCDRGYCTLGVLSIPYNLILGTVYWVWKKYFAEKLRNVKEVLDKWLKMWYNRGTN